MKKIIFAVLTAFFVISLQAEENPVVEENPAEKEFECKSLAVPYCINQTGICLQPVAGTGQWEKALDCVNWYKECISVGYSACEKSEAVEENTEESAVE